MLTTWADRGRCASRRLPSLARHSFIQPAGARRGSRLLGKPAAPVPGLRWHGAGWGAGWGAG